QHFINFTILSMGDYKDLIVFQKAYKLAMDILKSQRNFLLRKNMVSLTKLEDHPDLFALILPKCIEKEDVTHILFQSCQIRKQKIRKRRCGLTFRETANIYQWTISYSEIQR